MASFNFETTLIPLVLLILLGWLVGKVQEIDLKSISTPLIYAFSPVVAFGSTAQLSFHGTLMLLPLLTLTMAAITGLVSFAIGQKLLREKDMCFLLPQATGSGNNGYYGLPLAMALFPPEQVGIYFLVMLGTTLHESTFGYYFVGRGHLTVKHAFQRVIRMPVLYAIVAGLLFSALHVPLDASVLKLWEVARGCYVGIGMMIIGLALSQHKKFAWEGDFIALSMFGKHVIWGLAAAAFIALDCTVFDLFDKTIHTMIAILVITPVGANTAAFAAQHNFKTQIAATVVFVTTVISFAALPVVLPLMLALVR